MRLGNLPHTLLREVCESLATERDVMEQFFKAFRWSQSDQARQRWGIFGILKKHSATPVQLLRNVCASLLDDDDIAVKLLDDALLSYKPRPSLHLVRPLWEIRDIRNERIQRTEKACHLYSERSHFDRGFRAIARYHRASIILHGS